MNLIKLSDLNTKEIGLLIAKAMVMKSQKVKPFAQGKYMANLFYEPSTRTRLSFEMAQKKLGFEVINLNSKESSITKGETFYDTLKTIESIGVDGVVVRHTDANCFDGLNNINIPIINAGNGCENHPTQALTDLMTLVEEFGNLNGIQISIVGDIEHSRVATDNIHAFKRFGAKVNLVSSVNDNCYEQFQDAVRSSDVIMLLRNQYERHGMINKYSNALESKYIPQLTPVLVKEMKKSSIIMHPAPFNRGVEIHNNVVECDKSRIFKQMQNGVFARMAVLDYLLRD